MKKRNIFICLLFSLLMCLSLNFLPGTKSSASAEGSNVVVTFDALTGTCEVSSLEIAVGTSISDLPIAEYSGFYFVGWKNPDGAVVDENTTFDENTTLTAKYLRKNFIYDISKSGDNIVVSAKTEDETFDYKLTDQLISDIDEILPLIKADLASSSTTATLNFLTSFVLTEDLHLNIFNNLTLSGVLNLANFSVKYTAPENSSNFTLKNLTINSTSSQDMVVISGTNYSTVVVSDTNFDSTISSNNYALKIEKLIHTIQFEKTLSYSTAYLYNYEPGKNTQFPQQPILASGFSLTTSPNGSITSQDVINIAVPYYADQHSVLTIYNTYSLEKFKLFSTMSNYSVSSAIKSNHLKATTSFDIKFNKNNDDAETSVTANTTYKPTSTFTFPTEDDFSKQHFDLSGYVAKVNIFSTIWYFDKTSLENFINNGSDISDVSNYFSSTMPTSDISCFNYYKNDSSDLNYLAIDLMLSLGQIPEFEAIWTDTLYTITLKDENGEDISIISQIINSAVELPIPTKTGYTFDKWLTAESEPVSITTMSDTNPTLYASWKINSYKLTIHQNNSTSPYELSTQYGEELELIEQVNPTLISKTGYTFAGWFTNTELTNPLAISTMPAEDLTIYAKWIINQYTITLYINHPTNNDIFKTSTYPYRSNIEGYFSSPEAIEGYSFTGWFTDPEGRNVFTAPAMMPAENITLYAYWAQNNYRLNIKFPIFGTLQDQTKFLHLGDDLNLLTPSFSGLIFEGWYTDSSFETELDFTSMPSRDIDVYAKLSSKLALNPELNPQTYTFSENDGFSFDTSLTGFVIEYFVDNQWTTNKPTQKGSYDVKIIRAEDEEYLAFEKVVEDGLVITANHIDISVYSLILYCLAALELLCAIIILFIRRQRKTYLAYSVVLPFGIISTTDFVNFVISLTLAVFGFVLLTIQIVKLRRINHEIELISSESDGYSPPDVSENESISKKVEILLEKEGFVSANDLEAQDEDDNDKNDDDDNDHLSFDSKK